MKFVALTTYIAATISFSLAAETLKVPKWINIVNQSFVTNVPGRNLESRSICDIQNLERCMLTFFGSIGLSNTTLPSIDDLNAKFYAVVLPKTPQGFKELCSYISVLSKCAPSSDCWTLDSMDQLNFPDGRSEAFVVFGNLMVMQDFCTNYYQMVVDNFNCIFGNRGIFSAPLQEICSTRGSSCADTEAFLTCTAKFFSKNCNNDDVGKMVCNVAVAQWKQFNVTNCNSEDLDNSCNKVGGLHDRF